MCEVAITATLARQAILVHNAVAIQAYSHETYYTTNVDFWGTENMVIMGNWKCFELWNGD